MIHPRYECYIGSLMVRQISQMSEEKSLVHGYVDGSNSTKL